MKNQEMYNSKEEFESKNNIVVVESPHYEGKKCAPAQIICSHKTRKQAENTVNYQGNIMTRKQAKKFMNRWNSEFEAGNLEIYF